MSEATKERVRAAAEQLGYAGPDPRAASLRRGRSGIVGVLLEDRLADAFRDPINIAMLDGIAEETGAVGAGLLLLTESGTELANVTAAPMDAAILIACSTRLDESVARLRQRGLPLVAIEADDIDGVLAIGLDNREATARGAQHLRELGHSRVAVVALPIETGGASGPLPRDWDERATSFTALERLRGARDVFGSFDGWIADGSTIEAGYEAAMALLSSERIPRPTAIIAQSDLVAIGVIRAARQLRLSVPEDLSVLGFDGIDIAEEYELTTLVQPAQLKGRAAGRAVVELLAGGFPEPVGFTCELRIGATTGPAPS